MVSAHGGAGFRTTSINAEPSPTVAHECNNTQRQHVAIKCERLSVGHRFETGSCGRTAAGIPAPLSLLDEVGDAGVHALQLALDGGRHLVLCLCRILRLEW